MPTLHEKVREAAFEISLRDIEQAFNSLKRRVDNLTGGSSTGYEAGLYEGGVRELRRLFKEGKDESL